MPPQGRARSAREESPHRKPFSAAPSPRSKYSFPVVNTPVLRRSRHNTENQPPEVALNVKANSPFSETNASPALHPSKSASAKGKHHGSLSLPPRPPPPRPSPCQNPVKSGTDAQCNVKRKLNLEPPVCTDTSVSCHPPHEQDNGVKVIIRLRPCNQKEESEEATQIVEKISSDSLCLADQSFTFDHVAGKDSSQQSLFEMVGLPLVENCLQGFNSSIFAYGQTGSGKTFTMWGTTQDLMAQPPSEERGITPRVFERLFQRIKEEEKKNVEKQLRYQCRCSFFEIYNEQITDLLEPLQKTLQVREDTKTGVYVENLTEEFVSSVLDVFRLMVKGLGNRKIASTTMNLESSRSHTLFTCVIESRCKSMSDGVSSVRTSRMNLVDLAGSERQKLTGAAGDRLKEAGNINRSLSQLGNLINILAEVSQSGKPRHIPYRDSRLTFLLQESLGGNAKLAMICAISPASSCKSETLSTLRFAQRAKSIQNKAVVNEETEDDVKILREQIRQLKDELMRMKSNETILGAAGSYSTSWNARRSFNLLRMSLNRPMTLPHTDSDTDEEMEIDEDAVECADTLKPNDLGKTDCGSEKKLQSGHCGFDADLLLDSIRDEDVNFMGSVQSPTEDASVADCPTELVKFCAEMDDGPIGIEGLYENIKSNELPAQESSIKSHADENSEIELHSSGISTVNVVQSSCSEKLLAPIVQETSDTGAENFKIDLNNFDNDIVNLGQFSCSEELLAPPLEDMEADNMKINLNDNVGTGVENFKNDFDNDIVNLGQSSCSEELLAPTLEDIEADNVKINLNDNVGQSSCPEEGLSPTLQATDKPLCQTHAFEVFHLNMKDPSALEMECRTCDRPAFQETTHEPLSFSSYHSDSFLQAENGGMLLPGESPLQESSSVEPESRTTECISHDKGVWNLLPAEICRTSCQKEQSVYSMDSKGYENIDPAPARIIKSLSDDFEGVKMSAEFSNAHSNAHYLEGFAEPDQSQVRFDVACSWVGANASQPGINQDEACGPGGEEDGTDGMSGGTPETEHVLKSPILSISPHLAPIALEAPILSVSPRLIVDRSKSFGMSALPVLVQSTSIEACTVNYVGHEDAERDTQIEDTQIEESMETAIKASHVKTNLRASRKAPILCVSPRLIVDRSKSFDMSSLPVLVQGASIEACTVNYMGHEDAERYTQIEDTQIEESMETAIKASHVKTNLRASQNLSSPTDRLAASLHRGLQILENHQKKVNSTRMSMVRFSFQKPEWDKPKVSNTVSKSVQTSPVCFSERVPELLDIDLSAKQVVERLNLDQVSMVEPSTPKRRSDFQLNENTEAILAGALRRERAMEEDLNKKAAEIEQLNRLVRQYKHERECNAVLQQSLEDKIARLESLMDGTLPTDSFLNEEWSSLIDEHKILQERYDHHPEVTLANIRQQLLCEEIEKYRTFCELGERDALLGEISQLRNQLQYYVEFDTVRPMKQRQKSLTPQPKVSAVENEVVGRSPLLDEAEPMEENSNPTAAFVECQMCEKEAAQWMEREGEWMSVLEELRVEVEEYKQLAEKRKHEVGGQQRCANDMKEALQMAMEGHARLLDQYAELQEKHIGLLAKHRRIRDAMSTARKNAGKMKFLGGGKWYEAQAAELIAVKLEQEQERKAAKEQIEGLQAQLRDTADAVQAAGELLVRLKEAEEAVLIAQDAAALAEQDADKLYREIDKLKRRHSTELATLQQRLLEARLQKSSVCPMCVMAERVKFEFTEMDEEEAKAATEALQQQQQQEGPRYFDPLDIL